MIQVFRSKALKLFSLIAMIFLALVACKEKTLPEATSEGKGTFGMLINDTIWEPFQPSPFSFGSHKPELYFYKDLSLLEIVANNWTVNQKIIMAVENVISTGDYQLSPHSPLVSILYPDSMPSNFYKCLDSTRFELEYDCPTSYKLKGASKSKINISYLDTLQKIVSGTFEIELTNPKGETLKIKRGVFDSHYLER